MDNKNIEKAHQIKKELDNYLTVLQCDYKHTRVLTDFIILKIAELDNKIEEIIKGKN